MIKRFFALIKEYWNTHKDVPLFKAKVLLVILLIIALLLPNGKDESNKKENDRRAAETTSFVGGVSDEEMGKGTHNYGFSFSDDNSNEHN